MDSRASTNQREAKRESAPPGSRSMNSLMNASPGVVSYLMIMDDATPLAQASCPSYSSPCCSRKDSMMAEYRILTTVEAQATPAR